MDDSVSFTPQIISGMEYKEFFGLHGALPMAFSERLIFDSKEDQVNLFFKDLFCDFVIQKEQLYYYIVHSYIKLFFKKNKSSSLDTIKKTKAKGNIVGQNKLGDIFIGEFGIHESKSTSNVFTLGKCKML